MKSYKPLFILACAILGCCTSCTVEDLDIKDLNTDSLYVRSAIDVPIAQVTATIEDIMKHDRCKGEIVMQDTTIVIDKAFKEHITYPILLLKGTYVEELDTFMNLPFKEKVGEGRLIDNIESFILKVEVENTLPLSIDYKIIFLHRDSVTGKISEIPELKVNQCFTAESADINATTNTIEGKKTTYHQFVYDHSHMAPISDINHIKVAYNFYLRDHNQAILTKNNGLTMKIGCYFKGGVLIHHYEF